MRRTAARAIAPPGWRLWLRPSCGNRFNLSSTGGACPHGGAARTNVPCPACGQAHAVATWAERAQRGSDEPPRLRGQRDGCAIGSGGGIGRRGRRQDTPVRWRSSCRGRASGATAR